ncbi:substrate-binding domain-containing protein [Streptomyces sp. NBC_00271]|uniref:substrate-binding domain-containing protein n=1 Tax=Streptomyces sp. NBC_00271 TaxID=2975697 RepID=UPI002E2C122D|nr:substrate-binding domain-containing protein [Streptomyces sp. NBC_00271]
MVSAVQSILTFTRHDATAAPLDCATGTLTLSGSTAFAPVLQEAAKEYHRTCPDAFIPITADTFHGSVSGLDTLAAAGGKTKPTGSQGLGDRLAFSDGPKSDGRPQLLPRPVALSLFTLVVNKDAGVQDLSLKQIRNIWLPGHPRRRGRGRLPVLADRVRVHLRRAARELPRRGIPALPRQRGRQGHHPLPRRPPLRRTGQTTALSPQLASGFHVARCRGAVIEWAIERGRWG